jgi:hypothetical protein
VLAAKRFCALTGRVTDAIDRAEHGIATGNETIDPRCGLFQPAIVMQQFCIRAARDVIKSLHCALSSTHVQYAALLCFDVDRECFGGRARRRGYRRVGEQEFT